MKIACPFVTEFILPFVLPGSHVHGRGREHPKERGLCGSSCRFGEKEGEDRRVAE